MSNDEPLINLGGTAWAEFTSYGSGPSTLRRLVICGNGDGATLSIEQAKMLRDWLVQHLPQSGSQDGSR